MNVSVSLDSMKFFPPIQGAIDMVANYKIRISRGTTKRCSKSPRNSETSRRHS